MGWYEIGRRIPKTTAALAAAMLLSGCALGTDPDQARICAATIPALDPGGSKAEILRVLRPPEPRTLRIEYRLPDGGARRHVTCRFAPESAGRGRAELDAVSTERGPVAGATLYLLKRYYLDTPEGVAGAPAASPPDADLPQVGPNLAYLVQQLLVGLPRTGIYALLAAAYALVFGLVGRVNLAFGELAAIGAAAAGLAVAALAAGDATAPLAGLALALLLAPAASSLHGLVAGRVAFQLVPARAGQASLIATVGLSLALGEYLRLAGGTRAAWIPPFGASPWPVMRSGDFVVTLTPAALATAAVGLLAAAGLVVAMRRSRFGRAWRAASDDPLAASLLGIDPGRLGRLTFAAAGGLAGLAGALVAVQYGALGFAGGFALGLKALAAAILGGVGSVGGAMLGGLSIGLFETLWSAYLPIENRDLALHVVLILAIVLRTERHAATPDLAR